MKNVHKLLKNPQFWIFILALFLRIYKLGSLPYGFHVDEVKAAWNSLSILKTGQDDHGGFLSLYYNSFGDYRPTGLFYFVIPSILIFGKSIFATRLPVALFGALTVFPIYWLANILNKNKSKINVGYLSSLLLAISPWSLNLSRSTNEVVISTFFTLLSLCFFIKLLTLKKQVPSRKITYMGLSIFFVAISYLLYHSIRFLAPLIFGMTFLFYFKTIKIKATKRMAWVCILATFTLTLFFSMTRDGLARFDQVSILKNVDTIYQIERLKEENKTRTIISKIFDSKFVVYSKTFINSYNQYFSGDFLIGPSAKPYRFTTPGTGLLTYIDFILVIIGLIQILRGNKSYLPLLLLLISPLPAAITFEDTPNLSRSFLMLPFLIMISGIGLSKVIEYSVKKTKGIKIFIFILLMLNLSYFVYMYINHSVSHRPFLNTYSGDSPTYRNVGNVDLALNLESLKNKYDKIIITNFPDSPYPWYAFFTNKEPGDFNNSYSTKTNERIYGNIIFSETKCPSENALIKYNKQNILIIDSWECQYDNLVANGYPLKIIGTIKRPDGGLVYTFLERDWKKPLMVNGVFY